MAASAAMMGANDRIRLGIIGPGARGQEVMHDALACPNVEFVGAADVYTAGWKRSRRSRPASRPTSTIAICSTTSPSTPSSSPRRSTSTASTSLLRSTPASTSTRKRRWPSRWITPSRCAPPSGRQRARRADRASVDLRGAMIDARRFLAAQPMGKITAIHGPCTATRRTASRSGRARCTRT